MKNYNAIMKAAGLVRARQIKFLLSKGKTWANIATELNISRQRAQQIYARLKPNGKKGAP